jgi:BASS family bile acid:Na+ symporter
MLDFWEKLGFVFLTFILMFGIGTSLEIADFKKVSQRPKPLLSGIFSQSLFMPLWALAIKTNLNLSLYHVLGFYIMALTPGGALSNMYSYYARANVALSMAMTVTTTLVSLFAFPLWITFLLQDQKGITIPHMQIVGSLALMLVPVIAGMALKTKSPKWARPVEQLSSKAGVILILYLVISGLVRNGHLLQEMGIDIYIAVLSLQIGGFLFGWYFSKLIKEPLPNRKAIGLETGIQNAALTFSIILLSFPGENQAIILQIPMLYAFCTVICSSLLALIFRQIKN